MFGDNFSRLGDGAKVDEAAELMGRAAFNYILDYNALTVGSNQAINLQSPGYDVDVTSMSCAVYITGGLNLPIETATNLDLITFQMEDVGNTNNNFTNAAIPLNMLYMLGKNANFPRFKIKANGNLKCTVTHTTVTGYSAIRVFVGFHGRKLI